ncbi:type III pantothenate kinase [Mangrovimonas xylaniphaga]|uniref:type III pantothenate kinase n=1 Tax=Mangrovimonas xylaniphaga TaxID=1645915 RepID=UPI0006B5A4E4|nr:type III pantothenate kinase [Mangrovimonas xylaniphaga]
MNLIVDVGNTFVKFAIFQQEEIIFKCSFDLAHFETEFEGLFENYESIQKCILSSVGDLDNGMLKLIQSKLPVLVLDAETKLPFVNAYSTPHTLGVDRVALVSAAVKNFPQQNVLVIDAGTCITYDFTDAESTYKGGAISPGIRMRYKSLNNLTANLPLLETEMPRGLIGDSTITSIHSGVVGGVLKEINGVVDDYRQEYRDLTVILTGGDSDFLSKQLKNGIFANSNFLLEGLNFILEYNLY